MEQILQRLASAGLVLSTGPTAVPGDAGVEAQNCDLGHQGSISKRPGYHRWRPTFAMTQPVMLFTMYEEQPLIIAGNVEDAS